MTRHPKSCRRASRLADYRLPGQRLTDQRQFDGCRNAVLYRPAHRRQQHGRQQLGRLATAGGLRTARGLWADRPRRLDSARTADRDRPATSQIRTGLGPCPPGPRHAVHCYAAHSRARQLVRSAAFPARRLFRFRYENRFRYESYRHQILANRIQPSSAWIRSPSVHWIQSCLDASRPSSTRLLPPMISTYQIRVPHLVIAITRHAHATLAPLQVHQPTTSVAPLCLMSREAHTPSAASQTTLRAVAILRRPSA